MKEVKTPKKPLIYYYMIVIIALLLFNFLAVPFITEREIKDVDYGTFIDMTNEGKVGKAEIQEQENTILFTDKDEEHIYRTAMVQDEGAQLITVEFDLKEQQQVRESMPLMQHRVLVNY